MRDSFIFYRSFAEAIKKLKNDDERLAIYEAIIDYALDGIEPNIDDIPAMAFTLIKPQIDANNKRYANGQKGGRPKANENQTETKEKPNNNQSETKTKPKDNQIETKPQPNENVNDNDNVNVNVIYKRFTPPTLDEVKVYMSEKGIMDPKEAEKFIDFYSCKGWMVGKNKMKDWQAAVRNWIKGMDKKPAPKQNRFNDFQQRDYDYGELEKMLIANG